MIFDNVDFLWTEMYRPKTIEECILPSSVQKQLSKFVETGQIMNLLFFGPPGTGKTSAALAICNQLDLDYKFINGSLNGNIDTLRYDITSFATSISLTGNRKVVIFDEADYLNPNSTQPALRGMIEEYSENCSFFFTCNDVSRIIEPIRKSRLVEIDFNIPASEHPKLASKIFIRTKEILKLNNINFEEKVLAELIKLNFPDYRRTINQIQRYSIAHGVIDTGILNNLNSNVPLKDLIKHLKDKNFTQVRKWVGSHSELIYNNFYRLLYDALRNNIKDPDSIANLVVIVNDYQFKSAFVADIELNIMACLVTIMSEIIIE